MKKLFLTFILGSICFSAFAQNENDMPDWVYDYNINRLVTDVGLGVNLYSHTYYGEEYKYEPGYGSGYYEQEEYEEELSNFGFNVGIGYTRMFNQYIGLNCIKFNYTYWSGFQWMAGVHVAVPLFYNRKLGSFALYASPNIGYGLDIGYSGSGFCFDIEAGIALASRLHLAFVYNQIVGGSTFLGGRIGWHY